MPRANAYANIEKDKKIKISFCKRLENSKKEKVYKLEKIKVQSYLYFFYLMCIFLK